MREIKYLSLLGFDSLNPSDVVEKIKSTNLYLYHLRTCDLLIGKHKLDYMVIHSKLEDFPQWTVLSNDDISALKQSNKYNFFNNSENIEYLTMVSNNDSVLANITDEDKKSVRQIYSGNLAFPVNFDNSTVRKLYDTIGQSTYHLELMGKVIDNFEKVITRIDPSYLYCVSTRLWCKKFKDSIEHLNFKDANLKFWISELELYSENIPEFDIDGWIDEGAILAFGCKELGFVFTHKVEFKLAYCLITNDRLEYFKDIPIIKKLKEGYYLPDEYVLSNLDNDLL